MSALTQSSRCPEFSRLCKALAASRGDLMTSERYSAARNWGTTTEIIKALVSPLSVEDFVSAMAPVGHDLAEVLRPLTIVGRLQGMRRVPFKTRLLVQDVGGVGAWVDEGEPIPVTAAGFADTMSLDVKKVGGIRILTDELMRCEAKGSNTLIANDAAGGVAQALDLAFIDPANGGNDFKPSSITFGATEVNSSGSTVAAIVADLKLMFAVLIAAECDLSTAAWIMSPTTAVSLALLGLSSGAPSFPGMNARGGTLLGLPVLTSTHVTATGSPGERFIVMVEASEICIADDNEARIDLSTSAAVQMDDAPLSGDRQLVSLWQHSLVGIKATKFCNWRRRRNGAVAVLRNVVY